MNNSFNGENNRRTQIPNPVRHLIIDKAINQGEPLSKIAADLRIIKNNSKCNCKKIPFVWGN
jgi:hypothetical protein